MLDHLTMDHFSSGWRSCATHLHIDYLPAKLSNSRFWLKAAKPKQSLMFVMLLTLVLTAEWIQRRVIIGLLTKRSFLKQRVRCFRVILKWGVNVMNLYFICCMWLFEQRKWNDFSNSELGKQDDFQLVPQSSVRQQLKTCVFFMVFSCQKVSNSHSQMRYSEPQESYISEFAASVICLFFNFAKIWIFVE